MTLKVAVAGANGYAGITLVNLLLTHPEVELTELSSRSLAGQELTRAFPLSGLHGTFVDKVDPRAAEVVFSCLPHNAAAAQVAEWLEAGARVIDLSADFRLKDPALYPRWYGREHPAPGLLAEAVLGLPELHAAELRDARLIACPGCYSTAAILALAPAVAQGLITSDVVVDAKSGVSGAGRSLSLGTHYAEVQESVNAYSLGGHRHHPEVAQELGRVAAKGLPRVTFLTHLVPMVRGILATCYFDADRSPTQVEAAYRDFYSGSTFTRVVPDTPRTKAVSLTNLCLVNVGCQGDKIIVTAALDNLMKGASGQAVECLNLAFGFGATTALAGPLSWP